MIRVNHTIDVQMDTRKYNFAGEVVIVCIGTDRSTGDSLGPLVGTNLTKLGVPNVYGTLEDPVHAANLEDTLELIQRKHPNTLTIAIDSSLGKSENVGAIRVKQGPIKPGSGVNKKLPSVGDIGITGCVNVGGFMEYFVLQNTRLSLVVSMADTITNYLVQLLEYGVAKEVAVEGE